MSHPSGAPRILQLASQLPVPARGGGHLRTVGIAKILATLGPVDVAGAPSAYGSTTQTGPYRSLITIPSPRTAPLAAAARAITTASPRVVAATLREGRTGSVAALARTYDLVVVESPLGAPLPRRAHAWGVPVIYSTHNIEQDLRYPYPVAARLLSQADRRALTSRDARVARLSAAIVCCTPHDAEHFRRFDRPVFVVPNCTDLTPVDRGWDTRRGVALMGSFGWLPNIEGLRWFTTEVLPALRTAGLPVHVVTNAISATDRRALEERGAEVHVNVPDVSQIASQTRVAVVPVLTGEGSRVRIADALGLAMQVVTTTVGGYGQPAEVLAACRVADNPAQFVAEVVAAHGEPAPPPPHLAPRWHQHAQVANALWEAAQGEARRSPRRSGGFVQNGG